MLSLIFVQCLMVEYSIQGIFTTNLNVVFFYKESLLFMEGTVFLIVLNKDRKHDRFYFLIFQSIRCHCLFRGGGQFGSCNNQMFIKFLVHFLCLNLRYIYDVCRIIRVQRSIYLFSLATIIPLTTSETTNLGLKLIIHLEISYKIEPSPPSP